MIVENAVGTDGTLFDVRQIDDRFVWNVFDKTTHNNRTGTAATIEEAKTAAGVAAQYPPKEWTRQAR